MQRKKKKSRWYKKKSTTGNNLRSRLIKKSERISVDRFSSTNTQLQGGTNGHYAYILSGTQGNLSATVLTIKKKVISRRDYHQWHNRLKEKSKSGKNNNEQSLPLHEITF